MLLFSFFSALSADIQYSVSVTKCNIRIRSLRLMAAHLDRSKQISRFLCTNKPKPVHIDAYLVYYTGTNGKMATAQCIRIKGMRKTRESVNLNSEPTNSFNFFDFEDVVAFMYKL